MNRLVIVPDPALETAGALLKSRLTAISAQIDGGNFTQFIGPHALQVLHRTASDAETILWAPDGPDFAIAWTSGKPEPAARSSKAEGLIARVFESQRSDSETADDLQAADWTNLERLRGNAIEAMAASPVIVFENAIAVLTKVRYRNSPDAQSPPAETASLLGRLIEDRLIRTTLGLEST